MSTLPSLDELAKDYGPEFTAADLVDLALDVVSAPRNKKSPATHEGRPGVSEAKEGKVSVEKVTMWKSDRGLICKDEISAAADDALQTMRKACGRLDPLPILDASEEVSAAALLSVRQVFVDAEEALSQLRRCIDRDATTRA